MTIIMKRSGQMESTKPFTFFLISSYCTRSFSSSIPDLKNCIVNSFNLKSKGPSAKISRGSIIRNLEWIAKSFQKGMSTLLPKASPE